MYPFVYKIILVNLIIFPILTFIFIDLFLINSLLTFRILSIIVLITVNIIYFKIFRNNLKTNYSFKLNTLFWGCFIIMLILFINRIKIEPYGMWDSWAIWSFKAKDISTNFILNNPQGLFKINWNHPGYPLFLPYQIAFVSIIFGNFNEIIVYFIHILYLYLFVSLMFYFISLKFDLNLLFFTLLPFTFFQLYIQFSDLCADFPLSIFSAYSLYFYFKISESKIDRITNILFLGFSMGILPHIKNEGIFIFLIYIVFFIINNIIIKSSIESYYWIPISLFILSIYLIFKSNAPEVLQFEVSKHEIFQSFIDWNRYINIGLAFSYYHLLILYGIIPVFLYYSYLKKFKKMIYLIPLFIIYLIFNGIFFITRYDQIWHISTAYSRVNFQISPLLFLTFQYIYFQFISFEKQIN